MHCWGNIPLNSIVPFFFDAFDGGTGASITLTGLAVTDIEIYKGISMTQRASDAGVVLLDTDGIDVDGVTGIHGFSIDTSDNTDAGFYAAGSFYTVVVASVTIDGQTVNFVAGTFRLSPAEALAGHPKVDVGGWLGTAPSTPTVAGVPNVNTKTWNDLATVALPLIPATAGRSLVVDAAGLADANMVKVGPSGSGTAQTARDLGASVLLSSGTGAGQLDFTAGVVKANLAQILGTALTETAGQIAAAFKKFFDKGAPTGTVNSLPDAVAGAASGLAIVGSNVGTTTSLTGDAFARLGAPAGASVSADIAAAQAVLNILQEAGVIRRSTAQGGAAGSITLDAGASAVNSFYRDQVVVLVGGTGAGQSALWTGYTGATKVLTVTPNWDVIPDSTTVFIVIPNSRSHVMRWRNADVNNLVSGRVDVSVGAMAANVITAAATAADFGTEVAAAVWDALTSGMATVGSIGKKLADWVVGTIDTYTGNTKQTGDAFARLGAPAGASVSADVAAVKTETAAIKAKTDNLPSGPRKNVALPQFTFLMVDSADHVTPKTGLTVAGTISKDGGAFVALTNAIAEVGNGVYRVTSGFTQPEMNADALTLRFTATGADARIIVILTSA